MSAAPGYQVVSTPELLDKIFEFVDIKTLLKARTICRQWRTISQLYLKRRMSISRYNADKVMVTLNPKVQEASLFNKKKYHWPEIGLVVQPHANDTVSRSIDYYAAVSAIIFELDWLPNLTKLKLHDSLTVDDWMIAGSAVLKKMTALSSLMVEFRAERSRVIPLYFSELEKSLGKDGDGCRFDSLKRVHFRFHRITFQDPTPCDAIVHTIFATCQNLVTFKMSVTRKMLRNTLKVPQMYAWVARSTDPENANAEMMSEWEGGLSFPRGFYELKFNSVLAQCLVAMLKKTQPQKFDVPADLDLLSLFVKNSTMSRLKVTSQATDDLGGLPLWVLQWWCSQYKPGRHFQNRAGFMHQSAFPNVRWLVLNRDGDASGAEADSIYLKLHQILPNVARLVINVYNQNKESNKYKDDLDRVLKIVSSFEELKHLVLINDQPAGTASSIHSFGVLSCLEGLESLTLSIVDPLLLRYYSRCAFVASERIPSIKRLGFFRRGVQVEPLAGTAFLDIVRIGMPIPKHVTVSAGAWTDARAIEAGEKKSC